MCQAPKVFISYSWEDEAHNMWIENLVKDLRGQGIDASFDRLVLQNSTVNLYQMMISNLVSSDFIIVVLTKSYCQKANDFQGGVGFETTLLIQHLQSNQNKIILVAKDISDDAIPHYLKGWKYYNASSEIQYTQSLEEIVYHIYQEPMIEQAPLGKRPVLTARPLGQSVVSSGLDSSLIPNLKKITDYDKDVFLENAFQEIVNQIDCWLTATKNQNSNFDYRISNIGDEKKNFSIYVDGVQKINISFWIDSLGGCGQKQIFIGQGHSSFSGNSFNDYISVEEQNGELKLKRGMAFFSSCKEAVSIEEISESVWQDFILNYLK